MMANKTALLAGATGLTGKLLLQLLLKSSFYRKVTVLARKSTGIQHDKLTEIITDFDDWNQGVEADDVFICLGTTIKKAKTKQAFKKVDQDYPVKIATLQLAAGSQQLAVISAMGADANSLIFYNRVKGNMEKELLLLSYPHLFIFRPSLITGNREEKRNGEKTAVFLARFINPLLLGPLKKYRSVSAKAIASCMLHYTNSNKSPMTKLILSDTIQQYE